MGTFTGRHQASIARSRTQDDTHTHTPDVNGSKGGVAGDSGHDWPNLASRLHALPNSRIEQHQTRTKSRLESIPTSRVPRADLVCSSISPGHRYEARRTQDTIHWRLFICVCTKHSQTIAVGVGGQRGPPPRGIAWSLGSWFHEPGALWQPGTVRFHHDCMCNYITGRTCRRMLLSGQPCSSPQLPSLQRWPALLRSCRTMAIDPRMLPRTCSIFR